MAEEKKKKNPVFSHKVIMGALALVLAGGGSYGGYQVAKTYGKYGAQFDARPHLVAEVVDGDTLIIEDGIRVRLLGIDAPETQGCFYKESKEALARLALGSEIILEKDQTAKDSFGRLLRYAFLYKEDPEADNIFLNKELIKGGFAKSDYLKPNRRYLSELQASEREAEESRTGMWGSCDMTESKADPDREQASEPYSDECIIKASISKDYTKNYFVPGCPNYKRVKVDPRKGEAWFCTEQEAQAEGWQKSPSCSNI